MARDTTLSKAVQLLRETEDAILRLKVSKKSRGSARELSIRMRNVRVLLEEEAARTRPNWWLTVELIREAVKLIVDNLIDNAQ